MEERELHIPVIFTTGEMLYAHQREILERKFAGRVFDYYGSNEVSALAFECEYGCRHITDEQVVLEVVDDADQPLWDVSGRILVTDFRNMAMPFIRYELGDRGVLSRAPCQCGRHLLVLKELEGRSQDAIRGPNGVALSGVFFAGRFRNLERIRAYQVVQQSETVVELRYVSARPDAQTEVNEIVAVIREHLGAAVRIEERCFDTLPLNRKGAHPPLLGESLVYGLPRVEGGFPKHGLLGLPTRLGTFDPARDRSLWTAICARQSETRPRMRTFSEWLWPEPIK